MADQIAEHTVCVKNWLEDHRKLRKEQDELARKKCDLEKEEIDLRNRLDKNAADSEHIRQSLEGERFSLARKTGEVKTLFSAASGKHEEDLFNEVGKLFAKSKEVDALLKVRHPTEPSMLFRSPANAM